METIIITALAVLLVLSIIGTWLGSTDRAVFFHSKSDVFVSAVATIIGIVVICQPPANNNVATEVWLKYGLLSAALALIILYNGRMSLKYNNAAYTIFIICGRVFMSLFGLLALSSFVSLFSGERDKNFGERSRVGDAMVAAAIVAGYVAFVNHLINKDRLVNRVESV